MNRITTTFLIRGDRKNHNESASIALRVFINSQKVVISIGIVCPIDNWDKESQSIRYIPKGKVSRDQAQKWNSILTRIQDRVNDLQFHFTMKNMVLTPEIFKREMREDARKFNFYSFLDNLIPLLALRWSPGTIRNHIGTIKKLKEFAPDISYGDINDRFLIRFEGFLKGKGLGVNSVWKHHKDLRMFINEAIKSGVKIANPYEHYKLIKAKGTRAWLTNEEVVRLRDLMLSGKLHPSHDKVIRYFLFSCFTGLRISDVKKIRFDDILEGQLVFIPVKTKRFQKIVKVPLNDTAQWLIGTGEGKIFDIFAEQVTNRYLKEVASIAGINKCISFHVSRHTFAMRFLERGGKIEVLKEILGHSAIETTMEYVHELNQQAKIQMMYLDN
jgi:site-specific recombinase XerD